MADGFRAAVPRSVPQAPAGHDRGGPSQAIADGRIMAAPRALTLHLVDRLGYIDDALAEAEHLAGVSDAEVVLYHPERKPGPLALRDRTGTAATERGDPVQLPRPGSDQAAHLPLPLAARPDPAPDLAPVIPEPREPLDPEPREWPVLVTGAAGFVGGHIARQLAGLDIGARACAGTAVDAGKVIRRSIGSSATCEIRRPVAGPGRSASRDPRGRLGQPGA